MGKKDETSAEQQEREYRERVAEQTAKAAEAQNVADAAEKIANEGK